MLCGSARYSTIQRAQNGGLRVVEWGTENAELRARIAECEGKTGSVLVAR